MVSEPGVITTSIVLDDSTRLGIGELCRCCDVSAEFIITLVDEGLLEPEGREPADWRFSGAALPRIHAALRLQRDLHVNLPGIALVLDLLEESRRLRAQVQTLERLLGG